MANRSAPTSEATPSSPGMCFSLPPILSRYYYAIPSVPRIARTVAPVAEQHTAVATSPSVPQAEHPLAPAQTQLTAVEVEGVPVGIFPNGRRYLARTSNFSPSDGLPSAKSWVSVSALQNLANAPAFCPDSFHLPHSPKVCRQDQECGLFTCAGQQSAVCRKSILLQ